MNNLENIFDIICIENEFSIKDLLNLGQTSKYINNITKKNINDIKNKFETKTLKLGIKLKKSYLDISQNCSCCDIKTRLINVFNNKIICNDCNDDDIIQFYKIRKNYSLNENDLIYLDFYLNQYKEKIYNLDSVKELTYLKYGKTSHIEIYKKITSFEKRNIKLNELINKYLSLTFIDNTYNDDSLINSDSETDSDSNNNSRIFKKKQKITLIDIIKKTNFCETFLKNGYDGIRKLEKRLIVLNNFLNNPYFKFNNIKSKINFFDNFIKNNLNLQIDYNLFNNEYKSYLSILNKKKELNTILNKYDINKKKYSNDILKYTHFDNVNINDIVNDIREKDFFLTKTNYANIHSTLIYNNKNEVNEIIRIKYSNNFNRFEEDTLLNSIIDYDEISKEAKMLVLKNIKNKNIIPDFLKKLYNII
jgi:hypothetical protein